MRDNRDGTLRFFALLRLPGLPAPGGLFILSALMSGVWIAVAVIGGVPCLTGSVMGGILSGPASPASRASSGIGVMIGIMMGPVLYAESVFRALQFFLFGVCDMIGGDGG